MGDRQQAVDRVDVIMKQVAQVSTAPDLTSRNSASGFSVSPTIWRPGSAANWPSSASSPGRSSCSPRCAGSGRRTR
ncbi:hypothetical protein ACFQ3Z_25530 [Streptomyces nogalater]